MRVLNINKYHQLTGGGDRFFFDTATILTQHGHEVVPFCLDYPGNRPSPYSQFFPKGITGQDVQRQSPFFKLRLFFNGIYSLDAKFALRKLIRKVRPDVAHLHVVHYTMSPSVIDALHEAGIPIVFSLHDYRFACASGYLYTQNAPCRRCEGGRYYNAVRFRCYRDSLPSTLMGTLGNYLYRGIHLYDHVDAFTVPQADMASIVAEFGLPREKIHILRNPLLEESEPAAPASLGAYALFYGNISRQKGVFTLVQAALQRPNIPLVICGTGRALDDLRRMIAASGARHIEIDTTTRWNSGLQEKIQGARFVVSPSEWEAPLEYVTVESMAMGKTVLASNIGGNRAVIEDQITGLFFSPGDAMDLAKSMIYLYDRPELCMKMGQKARQQTRLLFSPEQFYKSLMLIYGQAISSRSRPTNPETEEPSLDI